jgi:hypothetical protein
MVEPAIAITAMNIATLRPLFKNFFNFATKRFDTSINTQNSDGTLVDFKSEFMHQGNNIRANEYSAEFAQLLGLSRWGVTTEISAGCDEKKGRMRFMLGRNSKKLPDYVEESKLLGSPMSPGINDFNWATGIRTTTTIMQETR